MRSTSKRPRKGDLSARARRDTVEEDGVLDFVLPDGRTDVDVSPSSE